MILSSKPEFGRCMPMLSSLLIACAAATGCGGANEPEASALEVNQALTVRAPATAETPFDGDDPAAEPVAEPTPEPTLEPVAEPPRESVPNPVSTPTAGPAPVPGPVPVPPPAPAPPPEAPAGSSSSEHVLAWSNPATWGGLLPTAGAEVVIPAGRTITLDVTPPNLGGLRIEGTLRFARKDLALTAGYIDLTGALEIGTAAQPFAQKATITLNGAPQSTNDGVSRGLNVRGGRLELYGVVPQPVWTKLNDHAEAGATSLTLKDKTVRWRAGDLVAVAPTDFYKIAATERIALAAADGNQLSLASPLGKFRWGKLQYVTNNGMSLTPDPTYEPPAKPAPTVLDERAVVANLTRNIVIQGADDAPWRDTGYGAHLMIMSLSSKVVVDGVEMRRVGQSGHLARYPIHWHLLSYAPDGQMLGDATGHALRNSSIWNSSQRCVVVHATNGLTIQNNICQDILGHAYFMEDAVERRNVFEGNLALMTRSPPAARRLQVHEGDLYDAGPSGFWITNPDNVIRGNHAGDSQGNGFWLAFPTKPLGSSKGVPLRPDRIPLGDFDSNTAHTSRGPGVLLNMVPSDDAGNVVANKYAPVGEVSEAGAGKQVRFQLKRLVAFKNLAGAYRNYVSLPDYLEWVAADNAGTAISGAGTAGVIERGLFVGESLNNSNTYPVTWRWGPPVAFASYHSTFNMRLNTVVNFPFLAGYPSGAFRTSDFYMTAVDKGTVRNGGNRLIKSHPGYRTPPPNMDGQPLANRHWTYAGALWDPHGYWGPKERFWVYDMPFLTYGAKCDWVQPAGQNGKTCDGQYYGVGSFQTDFDASRYRFFAPVDATRIDSNGNEIGRWSVADGATATMFGNMRHFAARESGTYILRFPGKPIPKSFSMNISNAFRSTDGFVMGISFDGSVTPTGYTVSGDTSQRDKPQSWPKDSSQQKYVRWFKPAASLTEVANGAGDRLWQDRGRNIVWIKVAGGLPFPGAGEIAPNSDPDIYRSMSVLLYPAK